MRRLATIVALTVVAPGRAAAERVDGVYLEALGKGGLWGLGFDHLLYPWLRVGAVGSAAKLESQHYISVSPYLGLYVYRHGRSAWFVDGGAQLAHVWVDSPVPEWDGTSSNGIGGMASTGYEFRSWALLRLFAHVALGKGGVLPWAGADVGFTF